MHKPLTLTLAAGLLLAATSCEIGGGKIDTPADYTFERNGASTVDYSGQTIRLAMGDELAANLLNFDKTETDFLYMYLNTDFNGDNVDPFEDAALNASDKSLRSKTAASYGLFNGNTIASNGHRVAFDTYLQQQAAVFNYRDSLASAGKAGQIADITDVRLVDAKGLEYDQLFIKGLIGALMTDQVVNHYLHPDKLDAGTNREDNENGVVEEGTNYTTMEHYWDEAYGYVFGGAADGAQPLSSVGQDDQYINKYLGRVINTPAFAGKAQVVFDAFKTGRAAIVAGDYDERDAQAEIIREELSELLGIYAVSYMEKGRIELAAGNWGGVFHDLSEGIGFIYALQFTFNPETGTPYFSASEVANMIDALVGPTPNGLWDITDETMAAMSATIAGRFSFESTDVPL